MHRRHWVGAHAAPGSAPLSEAKHASNLVSILTGHLMINNIPVMIRIGLGPTQHCAPPAAGSAAAASSPVARVLLQREIHLKLQAGTAATGGRRTAAMRAPTLSDLGEELQHEVLLKLAPDER